MKKLTEVLPAIHKQYGGHSIQSSRDIPDVKRLPTGVFDFDLATGGGFAQGRFNLIWGLESCGKTDIVLRAIGVHQKLYPDSNCVFIDGEFTFDPHWAQRLGVDVDKLFVVSPTTVEAVTDISTRILEADDVGLVALDSIASLCSQREVDTKEGKLIVAGAALQVNTLIRKLVLFSGLRRQTGTPPTLLAINQTRYKIAVNYGNNETRPGGTSQNFSATLRIRMASHRVKVDPKVHETLPPYHEIHFTIDKFKLPIVKKTGTYRIALVAHKGRILGAVDDIQQVTRYAKAIGILTQPKGKYVFTLPNFKPWIYKNLGEIREDWLVNNPRKYLKFKAVIFKLVREKLLQNAK